MGMGWAGITVAQLKEMMPEPMKRYERRDRSIRFETTPDGCGCCPLCRGFVYVRFDQPDGQACCPDCGGLIEALDSPGIASG